MQSLSFHPVVTEWFTRTLGHPTDVQAQAWPSIREGHHTLIAAPTGSGKTLAAFLSAINELVQRGLQGTLMPETTVLYVSPLKALGNDIGKNLEQPLEGIRRGLKEKELPDINIRVGVRSGDTTQSERAAMFRHPPHIMVTTPESLYLLLTSQNGRRLLSSVETVIIDEIHAMLGDKRGSHLSLSLERLEKLTERPLQRIGLSATQKPISRVADYLKGGSRKNVNIIDTGHTRPRDLALTLPNSPLGAIMANEVWDELYQEIVRLIESHRTTLIFVNTRRLAERLTHNLSERLGNDQITAHHGSMSKEHRHEAEQKLKAGKLRAIVATASLELGIDIGSVDLVCQIGSPRSIAAFLQRVGRSGHSVGGTPKGRMFPLTRDELVECAAILDAVRKQELDSIIMPEEPLDILAQQIVAEVAGRDFHEDELYGMCKGAYPYRNLTRETFDAMLKMLAEGYTTRKGRRGAYVHHDRINGDVKARKGARLTAMISGGAIPDHFDFDVLEEPGSTFVGTLNEDFAVESLPGDIFQLGNKTWRMLRIETGRVFVEDAEGLPPTIPFWFGEAAGRTPELSRSVSDLREKVAELVGDVNDIPPADALTDPTANEAWKQPAMKYLTEEVGLEPSAADQIICYIAASKAALTIIPSCNNLVLERFFDEAGDMHLVIHSPFGSRHNKAWGLSLRKRFCRKFNFELQAAANEDAIVLSLGSTHSFPLEEVFQYLKKQTVREILIQAMFDAPMFEVRWRWNASRALALIRRTSKGKVPPQIQRMQAEDLVALVFPDQLACLENIQGDREIPDHPLVKQTIHDCLTEAMDIDSLETLLERIEKNEITMHACDLREPSPISQEILNARPYAFLDNAPAEERRTNAIRMRRWIDPAEAKELGSLDAEAIANVRKEAWPEAAQAEELHDALILAGYITATEGKHNHWEPYFQTLVEAGRATSFAPGEETLWIATERLPEWQTRFPDVQPQPEVKAPEVLIREWATSGKDALTEIVRGRLEIMGPILPDQLSVPLGLEESQVSLALLALENDGFVFRGKFTPGTEETEWCERRLLARIHRYTLTKLRKEIEPVSAAAFMRFLFRWQGMLPEQRTEGPEALRNALLQLEGYEAQAAAWEGDILPMRVKDYDYLWLDVLCMSGQVTWGKFKIKVNGDNLRGPIKTTSITLVGRNEISYWKALRNSGDITLSNHAQRFLQCLQDKGADFFGSLSERAGLLPSEATEAVQELVAAGLITSDSFIGIRALLIPDKATRSRGNRKKVMTFSLEHAGRWSLLASEPEPVKASHLQEKMARVLLKRYGVVCRKLVERESGMPPWRDMVRVLRTMEARGEIRGGRFVNGLWGEQFALPEAIPLLRKVRQAEGEVAIAISAADPLNLTGIVTPGRRVPSLYSNRILYMNGEPVVAKEGKEIQFIKAPVSQEESYRLKSLLIKRDIPPKLRAYLGKGVV
ncbi:MAG: DEAD/DEAH box helicase [Flavobacteriales bacterium]|nr:DEAD/DEAH box helicase [Flavobacteriales bacterium]MCB9447878.1 DEAD/DEAH box helicase [Flavobacteriales bacterium]